MLLYEGNRKYKTSKHVVLPMFICKIFHQFVLLDITYYESLSKM